jgi:hypothetical protein
MGISQRCSNAVIFRIRTEEPDIGAIPYDWEHSCIYGAKEEIDHGTKALGKRVVFTTYVDANLFHDLISGKSVTGTLHWANQTVIDFSQLQSTVETATFGSNMLLPGPPLNRSLISGAPSDTSEYLLPSVMFGDNSCQHRFHAFLQTQQETQCIVYHKVVCIAANILRFIHTLESSTQLTSSVNIGMPLVFGRSSADPSVGGTTQEASWVREEVIRQFRPRVRNKDPV